MPSHGKRKQKQATGPVGASHVEDHCAESLTSPSSSVAINSATSETDALLIGPVHHRGCDGDANLKAASPWAREFDFTEAFYTPHTVLCLVCILLTVLLMLRYYYYPDMTVESKVKLGLSAALFVFLGFGAVNLPDSLMVRPHPAIWRGILACGIAYLVLLTFMLFLDLRTVQTLFGYYDPALRTPLPERQYAQDCRIRTAEDPYLFFHTAFDLFIIAHSLGYVFKALILRDWRMVTAVSLGFEVIEVSFQHVLPNFRECWWDHLLMDVLICNTGGTIVGMWLLGKLEAKKYNWVALSQIKTVAGKAQRVLGQFGPRSFEKYQWNAFESFTRFFQMCVVLVLMFLQEVNCFTMKAILNMRPEYHLVLLRLGLMCFLAMPALREFYEYLSNPAVQRIGTTFWVTLAALTMETIWIGKMMLEGSYFREEMPVYIAVPWIFVVLCFVVWLLLFFCVLPRKTRVARRGPAYHAVNLFFYLALAGVAALFCMGLPDLRIGRATFEALIAPYQDYILFWRNLSGPV